MTPIQRTNPHLEFLCIFQEETGDIFLNQFHQPRSSLSDLKTYVRQWAGRRAPHPVKVRACIKVLSGGKFIVVEEGFFKFAA